jgi:ring-1,2-phenylacetyl-CoA epoxidase subunit PaaD
MQNTLTNDKVWELLNQIPDPDIPVISITELGIVRYVEQGDGGKWIVTITPSYSGCPAMSVFREDIKTVLMENGAKEVELKISHSPAWTTDWLSEATREKMRQHGIAPPETNSDQKVELFSDSKRKITCPHCGKNETQRTSQFGSTPCKALWYCNACQQPFEYFKCY